MKKILSTKINFKAALILLMFFPLFHPVMGAWVENIPTTVKNPDGTVINCLASGDEFFNYLHDEKGYTIIMGEDGYHYYAIASEDTLKASIYRVEKVDPKLTGLSPHAGISKEEYQSRKDKMFETYEEVPEKAAHAGTLNNLVVYIRFSDDTEFTTPRSTYDGRLNNETAPSVKSYFQEVSYDMVTVESHHFPPSSMDVNISYQDTYPRSYFQPYNSTSNPDGYTSSERTGREHQLLHRAITAVAGSIPAELNIDNDNDGRVDNVCFVIKGGNGAWASILWAHRWALYSTNTMINGKRVWDYTFQPETQATVQILNHELFHTFGAPDLYRYSNNNITPVGPWDLMHSGSGHMGAFMKWKYSNQTWISDIPVISEPGNYTLNPLTSPDNNAYRINSPYSESEYFIVEYRKKEPGTYENNLPGSGLLVYRINTLAGNGNANGPPDEVYLYRLNGTTSLNGLVYSAHYATETGRTEISDATNPSSFLSDGSAGGLQISNVSSAGNTISFNLFGGPTDSFEITAEASPSHGGSIEGAGTWYEGHTAVLTASPADGFSFENWKENGSVVSSSAAYSFTAAADRHLVAHFVSAEPMFNISLAANPTEGGTVSGGGNHPQGESITVIATPSTGYDFISWTENGDIVSTQQNYTFTTSTNRELTANFALKSYQITLTANPSNGGNLTGAGLVDHGTVRAVNAFPASGFTFESWTENGEVVSTNTQYIFQATADRDLIANFSSNATNSYNITLVANPSEGGTLSGAGTYEEGQQATLSASTSEGYQFVNWTENGSVVSTQTNYSFTVTANRTLTANFSATTHTITLNASPVEGGVLSGSGSYDFGHTATVSATAAEGYIFLNWTENGSVVSNNASFSFTVSGNRTLTAHFTLNAHTITLNANPSAGGTVSGGGSYQFDQTATVTAAPANGYTFTNWTENGSVVSNNASYSFTVTGNRALTAHFTLNAHTITLNANPSAGGTVSGGGSYQFNQTATVTAAPANGYTFTNWTENGSVVSNNASYSFTVTGNRTLTAHFSLNAHNITLNANPAEGGTLAGEGNYEHGQTATAEASPNQGYTFINWIENGNVVSTNASYSFTVTGDRALTANFSINTFIIATNANPSEGGTVTGEGSYEFGQVASLSASPAPGFIFSDWSEDGVIISNDADFSFIVTANRTLTANFTLITHNIALNAYPSEGGSVSGEGEYNFGQSATVSATANDDFVFLYWMENSAIVSHDSQYSFVVNNDRLLTAVFESTLATITIDAESNPKGFAIIEGAGYYTENAWVQLKATPNDDSAVFIGWEENGVLVSSNNQFEFRASHDRSVVAVFDYQQRVYEVDVTIESFEHKGITVHGTGSYYEGEEAMLEVENPDNMKFIGWKNAAGQIVSRNNPYNFFVSRNTLLEVIMELKSADEMEQEEVVTVYPNPTEGRFQVYVENHYEMEVRNTSGLLLWKQSLEPGHNSVDITHLPLGMYLINLYGTEKSLSRKIILK